MRDKVVKNRQWQRSRFVHQDEEPLGPLANLLDLMLVFACGLIACLLYTSPSPRDRG